MLFILKQINSFYINVTQWTIYVAQHVFYLIIFTNPSPCWSFPCVIEMHKFCGKSYN